MTAPARRRPRGPRPSTAPYLECLMCGIRGMFLAVSIRTGLCAKCTEVAIRGGRVGQ